MTSLPAAPILVVDDRPDNLLAVEAVLAPLDLEVIRANSGHEALRHLLHAEVAVILLDVQMPGLDGYETARLIKARARTQNIPIIFLTARDRADEHELAAYGSGAVDYLAKPFQPEVLRSKVQVFVDLHRQAKTIESQRTLLERRLEERDRAEAALRSQAIELERSNAELERFALVASHDLREPLQVVAGFLDLLRVRLPTTGEAPVFIDRAMASTEGMLVLVDDLLTYARASTGEQHLEELALDAVLAEVEAQLSERIDAAGLRLTSDPLPRVSGDRWQLGRLFWHLLDHSVSDRADAEPAIHIGLTRRGEQWVVTVRHNGRGVDPADAPRLFTILGRLHPDGEDGEGSAGVGLAMCRRIVERHGGEIWIDDVPGGASAISFTLPVLGGDE